MNLNIYLGNAVIDAKPNQTPKGLAISQFRIAVNEKFGDKENVIFINCKAFDKLANLCNQYVRKGGQYLIQGRLTQQQYEKDGVKKQWDEVIISNIKFLSRPKDETPKVSDNAAFGGTNYNKPKEVQPSIVFTNDDIPF